MGEGRPPAKPGPPPSRFAANKKHAFLEWVADCRPFHMPQWGNVCRTAFRAKGPYGYAASKHELVPHHRFSFSIINDLHGNWSLAALYDVMDNCKL